MFDFDPLKFRDDHIVNPALGWVNSISSSLQLNELATIPRAAAVCLVLGALVSTVGARLLLIATVFLLVVSDLPQEWRWGFTQEALYAVGFCTAAVGLVEGALKVAFGPIEGGQLFVSLVRGVFMAVLGVALLQRRALILAAVAAAAAAGFLGVPSSWMMAG